MRIASIAVLAASISAPALAADLFDAPLRGTQHGSEPIAHWGGFYAGGHVGISRADSDFSGVANSVTATVPAFSVYRRDLVDEFRNKWKEADGRSFGAFVGYNTQFDEVVLGIEADFTRMSLTARRDVYIPDRFSLNTLEGHASLDLRDVATLRARAGYTIGAFMPFVTGGIAVGRGKTVHDFNLPGFRDDDSREAWSVGLTGGAGVDVALSRNLFLRGEWQYIRFGDLAGVQANVHNLRAAAGLKF